MAYRVNCSILILLVLLIAPSCGHHDPKPKKDIFEEKVAEKIIEPVQSDSCLLGDKMIDGKLRKDNFSSAKNVTKQNVSDLYSNYTVTAINDSIYKIFPKKLYSDARYFNRIILFDKNGAQKNAITFNEYDLADIRSCKEGYVVGLNSLRVSDCFAESNYACKIIMFDRAFNQLWERQEPHYGYYTGITSIEINKNISVHIDVQYKNELADSPDAFYTIDLDKKGKLKQVRIDGQPKEYNIELDSLKKSEGLK